MNLRQKRGLSSQAFARTPGLLAFLVCASRARRIDLSGDRFANDWIPNSLRSIIEGVYERYVREVYEHDDLVLSARNQFFLSLISEAPIDSRITLMPSGLVSYPYVSRKDLQFFEIDLPEVIEFKLMRAKELYEADILPLREVHYRTINGVDGESLKTVREILKERQNTIIIEGLSYYLEYQDWLKHIKNILSATKAGDIIAFDYWQLSEKNNKIYSHFKRFCEREAGFEMKDFNFLSEGDIRNTFGAAHVKITDVRRIVRQEFGMNCLSNVEILNDTLVKVTV